MFEKLIRFSIEQRWLVLLAALAMAALGVFSYQKLPRFTQRVTKPVRILSFVCLIGFIVGAVAGNWRYFLDYVGLVLLAVVLHDALAFGTGYACARLSGLPDYDRRAVTIEVGIRNAGLGLVLIFIDQA